MMKLLVTLLFFLGCSRSSPLAEPEDDYQYEDSDSALEHEETEGDHIDIQIISGPELVQGKVGEKIVLPCRVQPEGLDPNLVNRYWDRPDTDSNQVLAIGDNLMAETQEFSVEGSNFIILKLAEKHVGQYRCKVSEGQEVTHSLTLELAGDHQVPSHSSSSQRIISNSSSILGHSFYLLLLLLLL